MSTRLPIDGSVVSYWGFDEANQTDPAVEESGQGLNLTVFNSGPVVPARLGNGRQFDGISTYAAPASSSPYWVGINSLLVWIILDSVNQSGDLLRPVLTLEGPGAAADEDTVHGLYVDNNGTIIYRYTGAGRVACEFKSPAGAVRVNRYYSLAVTRAQAPIPPDGGGGLIITLYVNNVATPWATFTIDAAAQDPAGEAPQPTVTGALTAFKVGAASKSASLWHGVIDELSLHRIARPKRPYLDAAYYRLTLATTFQQLTTKGTVRVLAAVDMGGGTRWWCYERDQSVYVIRENSLGLFSAEVHLTSSPTLSNGALMPGAVGTPRLAYDAGTDTLVVAFVGAGKVYKVTGLSSDLPINQLMPTSADVASKIVAGDSKDLCWLSGRDGLTARDVGPTGTTDATLAATLVFLDVPSFGVAVYGDNPYGYALFRNMGGSEVRIGTAAGAQQTARPEAVAFGYTNYWFFPIAPRAYGAKYVAYALDAGGRVTDVESNRRIDYLGLVVGAAYQPLTTDFNALTWNGFGDVLGDDMHTIMGTGGTPDAPWTMTTIYPVKLLLTDSIVVGAGGAFGLYPLRTITTTPIKVSMPDAQNVGAGGGTFLNAYQPATVKSRLWRVQL